ncbi:hypothetical protein PENSPDRAFT_663633 [Peniophora sp. CONT]|nr:hypothetical protein PENSPDRAFT_663633 [Peniophora sp. CONT]
MYDTNLKTLLQSIMELLGSSFGISARTYALEYIRTDSTFSSRLIDFNYSRGGSPDSGTLIAVLQFICVLLHSCYKANTMTRPASTECAVPDTMELQLYLQIFLEIARNLHDIRRDEQFSLQARLCHFHLRWSLLLLIKSCPGVLNGSDAAFVEEDTPYSPELMGPDGLSYTSPYSIIAPKKLLSFLNSWQRNGIDGIYDPETLQDGNESTGSCLVPLHDAACCRSQDGALEHVAACTILTIVAHVLRASESNKHEFLQDYFTQYSRLWDHHLPFDDWDEEFVMSEEDRCRAPSHEFLAILRSVGLDKWVGPSGDLRQPPSANMPLNCFVKLTPAFRWTTFTFTDVLRTLASHVDMGAVPTNNLGVLSSGSAVTAAASTIDRHRLPTSASESSRVFADMARGPEGSRFVDLDALAGATKQPSSAEIPFRESVGASTAR